MCRWPPELLDSWTPYLYDQPSSVWFDKADTGLSANSTVHEISAELWKPKGIGMAVDVEIFPFGRLHRPLPFQHSCGGTDHALRLSATGYRPWTEIGLESNSRRRRIKMEGTAEWILQTHRRQAVAFWPTKETCESQQSSMDKMGKFLSCYCPRLTVRFSCILEVLML